MDVSNNGMANLAQILSGVKLQQQKDVAVLKMANDQMKQDGKDAIQLLQSVPKPSSGGSLGNQIDVMA